MPYKKITDLPDSVQDNLPERAQKIYLAVFNSAHEQYGDEVTAIKVAWSAVKKKYEKNKAGKWIQKK